MTTPHLSQSPQRESSTASLSAIKDIVSKSGNVIWRAKDQKEIYKFFKKKHGN